MGLTAEMTTLMERDPQLAFLPELVKEAERSVRPKKIILFGSRARGDHHRRSDVDVAFVLNGGADDVWTRFVGDMKEHLSTLLDLDLVDYSTAQEELRHAIDREGIPIYETDIQIPEP